MQEERRPKFILVGPPAPARATAAYAPSMQITKKHEETKKWLPFKFEKDGDVCTVIPQCSHNLQMKKRGLFYDCPKIGEEKCKYTIFSAAFDAMLKQNLFNLDHQDEAEMPWCSLCKKMVLFCSDQEKWKGIYMLPTFKCEKGCSFGGTSTTDNFDLPFFDKEIINSFRNKKRKIDQ